MCPKAASLAFSPLLHWQVRFRQARKRRIDHSNSKPKPRQSNLLIYAQLLLPLLKFAIWQSTLEHCFNVTAFQLNIHLSLPLHVFNPEEPNWTMPRKQVVWPSSAWRVISQPIEKAMHTTRVNILLSQTRNRHFDRKSSFQIWPKKLSEMQRCWEEELAHLGRWCRVFYSLASGPACKKKWENQHHLNPALFNQRC